MEEIKKFFETLKTNPKGKELLTAAKEPATLEEAADLYVGIAEKLGVSLSKENMIKFLQAREKYQQAISEKAEGAVKEALEEKDLDTVAGGAGGATQCADTFAPGEWCFITDSCAFVINYYDEAAIGQDGSTCPNAASSYLDISDLDMDTVFVEWDF